MGNLMSADTFIMLGSVAALVGAGCWAAWETLRHD